MYRKPKFLQVLHKIREAMSREVDYDVDLFAQMVRSGETPALGAVHNIRGFRRRAAREKPPAGAVRAPRKRIAR
jgi:hypothetical protein